LRLFFLQQSPESEPVCCPGQKDVVSCGTSAQLKGYKETQMMDHKNWLSRFKRCKRHAPNMSYTRSYLNLFAYHIPDLYFDLQRIYFTANVI
jgi:hypothetical protein